MSTKKIIKYDNFGRGITYHDLKIMFVDGAIPNEEVEIKNINFKKKYYEAEVGKVIKEANSRVVPKCPYYNSCGGCNIMHINYEEQLAFKVNKVKDIMHRFSDIDIDIKIIENDKPLFYRNKVSFKVSKYKWGLFTEESHDITIIDNCLITTQEINDILNNHEFINVEDGEVVVRTNYKKEILLSIHSKKKVKLDISLLPKNVVGIVLNNKKVYGRKYFYDYIDDMCFKVSYNSFFQVNNYMAGRIFNILIGNLKGTNLLDLYCGVGTLGQCVAHNFENIYGIEINHNAYLNAIVNAKNNNITNAKYYCGSTDEVLNDIHVHFDTIIIDPPRSGLNKATMKAILDIKPDNLAYISCDPVTLARDLKELLEYYEITKVNALDMFPNTYHVECVVLLSKRIPDTHHVDTIDERR